MVGWGEAGKDVAQAFFGDVQDLALQLSSLQVCEPPYPVSKVKVSRDIDPVCIGFTPAKVLSVSPLCSQGRGKGVDSKAGPRQPRAPIRV